MKNQARTPGYGSGEEKIPSLSHGIAFTVCGTLIIVLLTLLSLLGIGLLATWVTTVRAKGTPAMSLLLSFTPCLIVNFIALESVFILWDKKHKKRSLCILAAAVLVVLLSMLFCAMNTYLCDEEGLHRYLFGETGTYTWDDVTSATVGDNGDRINVTLRFPGKRTVSLSDNTTAQNKPFVTTYTSQMGYAAFVAGELRARGKFLTVSVADDVIAQYRGTEDEPFVKLLTQ